MSDIPTAAETLAHLEDTLEDLEPVIPVDISAQRVAAANAADPTVGPRLVLLEIWRPLRYIGSKGPRVFCREHLPVSVGARVVWGAPSPWRTCDATFAHKALNSPGGFFTLDQFPGVTFCVRKMPGGATTFADLEAAKALRAAHFKAV